MSNHHTRRQFLKSIGIAGATLATASGSAVAASDVTIHEDITYAERQSGELKLDLYVPDTDEVSPLIVWIHGGGWMVNTRKSHPDLREHFASQGYAMATISHRLSTVPEDIEPVIEPDPANPTPRGTFPDHIVDVKAAIRWLRAHASQYGIDPETVGIWGSSSGAHLATLAGTMANIEDVAGDVYDPATVEPTVHPEESGRVQAVVGWYPPTDFLQMDDQLGDMGAFPHNAANSPESLMIGGQITENEAKVQRANPITYVDPDDPPFLLMHGREDATVPYEQSEILFAALKDACVDTTFYELHDLGHGFGFEALTERPVPDQTISTVTCLPHQSDDGAAPKERTTHGAPAGPEVIKRFFDRHLEC